MSLLVITLISLSGLGGVYAGYLGFKNYRKITVTNEQVTLTRILGISGEYGLASTLVFFAYIMALGMVDENYHWSARSFISSLAIAMVAGIITILGSLYQVYTTVRYRGLIIRSLKKKD